MRWNLKEAVSKSLVRRTEITYKANAIIQLKDYLGCEKVISFGDAMNDIDMFNISDEAYAVANAFDELKQLAKGVIDSNNDDGVAKWLDNNMNGDVSIG